MFVFWEEGKSYLAFLKNASSTASGPPSPFALARGRLDAFAVIYMGFEQSSFAYFFGRSKPLSYGKLMDVVNL